MTPSEYVSFKVKQFRKQEGLSQVQLAKRAKVSQSTISRLETGLCSLVSRKTGMKVSIAMVL